MKDILSMAKFIISFASSHALLLVDPAGRINRELWWTNQEFSGAFLTIALHGGEWPASHLGRFSPEEKAPGIH
jgi:hypothetical protein